MKIKFLKKLVVGGLITSLCFCMVFASFKVKADVSGTMINLADDVVYERGSWVPNVSLNEISLPNELNGLFLTFNGNINSDIQNILSYGKYVDIYSYHYDDYVNYGFSTTRYTRSLDEDSMYNLIFRSIKGIRIANGLSNDDSYFELYSINYDDTYTLLYSYQGPDGYWYSNFWEGAQIKVINFPFRENNSNVPYYIGSNIDDFGSYVTGWNLFLDFFQTSFGIIMPSPYIELINSYYAEKIEITKEEYYNIGYNDGRGDSSPYRFTFLTGIFNGVSDILSLEIFPNVKLSYFIFVPLALGITGMIFWFWRKD